jgi:hypothetical protein
LTALCLRSGVTVTRVVTKQRTASNSADGPRKNLSPAVGEAKLASALSAIPLTSTQVPQRKHLIPGDDEEADRRDRSGDPGRPSPPRIS